MPLHPLDSAKRPAPFRAAFTRRQALLTGCRWLAAVAAGPALWFGRAGSASSAQAPGEPPSRPSDAPTPNIVLIYADDLGYGDLGCYGNRAIRTPHLDALAAEGMRFTDYYACNPICAPSRAGLLTGRYPFRSGIIGNPYPKKEALSRRLARSLGNSLRELGVVDLREDSVAAGLPARELTMAEALREAGYRTGMVGKWHLGDFSRQVAFNPRRHGFDFFFGVPHSNDMTPCPLYIDETRLEADIGSNQARLTGLYTREALDFVAKAQARPFFLYLAHTFPHQPLYASEAFAGRSLAGKYGDAVEELDWSVGRIVAHLRETRQDANTLILFASDNGPWFEGSTGALRGRKGQSHDGGFKVPFIAHWPGRIPSGSICRTPVVNLDLFPTLLGLSGAPLPTDRVIDGRDIFGLLSGMTDTPPHDAIFFYHYDRIEGVRAGRWKYFRQTNRYTWPVPLDTAAVPDRLGKKQLGRRWPLLYDLELDPGENYNVIDRYPQVAADLAQLMSRWETAALNDPGGWRSSGGRLPTRP